MTIAAGFACADGLVLCADRQISTDSFKYYEEKISYIPLKEGTVALAYAGLPDRMKSVHAALSTKIKNQSRSCDEARGDLQAVLDAEVPLRGEEPDDVHEMLCAIGSGGSRALLKCANRQISPVGNWNFIGFGHSALVRYLLGILTKNVASFSTWQARIICTYLVAQTKKYIPSIGGKTDIVIINEENQLEYVRGLHTEAIEREFENAEYAINVLLLTLSDQRATKCDCDMAISRFGEYLKEFSVNLRGHS